MGMTPSGYTPPDVGKIQSGELVWDPIRQTYVANGSAESKATTATNDATTANVGPSTAAETSIMQNKAATTAPSYISPVDQASIDATKASTALSGQKESFAEQMAQQKASMISGLMTTMTGKMGDAPAPLGLPTMDGGGGNPSPYDPAADSAAYGAAKDRIGNEGASALKGLSEAMAARGISGAGTEAAGERGIFSNMQRELGDTDRGLAEGTANRAFTAGQAGLDRGERSREFNASYNQSEAQRVQQFQLAQLSALLQGAGLY